MGGRKATADDRWCSFRNGAIELGSATTHRYTEAGNPAFFQVRPGCSSVIHRARDLSTVARGAGPWSPLLRIVTQRFPKWSGASRGLQNASRARDYLAVDGGVIDNQGSQALLDRNCNRVIVSDAAAALRPAPHQSRRHVPVLSRSQEIIYERVREAGYSQLKLRHNMHRLIEGVIAKRLDKKTAARWRRECGTLVQGYCYIELLPARGFEFQKDVPHLPAKLHGAVASIRTDLDRFSDIEISALMYHGYTLIDHALMGYNKHWIPNKNSESRFHCGIAGIDIDWSKLPDDEFQHYANHLTASDSRFAIWRYLRRAKGTGKMWLSTFTLWRNFQSAQVEVWRTISPGWQRSEKFLTIKSGDGEEQTTGYHTWKRREWRKVILMRLQGMRNRAGHWGLGKSSD